MTIKGFRQLLDGEGVVTRREQKDYRGSRLAVDMSVLLHQVATAPNHPLAVLTYKIVNILEQGIRPLFVFDGRPPPEKIRTSNGAPHNPVTHPSSQPSGVDTVSSSTMSVERGPLFHRLCRILELFEVPYIQAEGEADPLCVALTKQGICEAVVSTDYDVLVFGAERLIVGLFDFQKILQAKRRSRSYVPSATPSRPSISAVSPKAPVGQGSRGGVAGISVASASAAPSVKKLRRQHSPPAGGSGNRGKGVCVQHTPQNRGRSDEAQGKVTKKGEKLTEPFGGSLHCSFSSDEGEEEGDKKKEVAFISVDHLVSEEEGEGDRPVSSSSSCSVDILRDAGGAKEKGRSSVHPQTEVVVSDDSEDEEAKGRGGRVAERGRTMGGVDGGPVEVAEEAGEPPSPLAHRMTGSGGGANALEARGDPSPSPHTLGLHIREIRLPALLHSLSLSSPQLIDLALLSGCDYFEGLPNVGPLKALKILRAHGSIENYLASEGQKPTSRTPSAPAPACPLDDTARLSRLRSLFTNLPRAQTVKQRINGIPPAPPGSHPALFWPNPLSHFDDVSQQTLFEILCVEETALSAPRFQSLATRLKNFQKKLLGGEEEGKGDSGKTKGGKRKKGDSKGGLEKGQSSILSFFTPSCASPQGSPPGAPRIPRSPDSVFGSPPRPIPSALQFSNPPPVFIGRPNPWGVRPSSAVSAASGGGPRSQNCAGSEKDDKEMMIVIDD
uniref:Exonuclease 1 n=1 Tax=Chromera velia CCMP2878 TaxID=1169474 RepID=A0A0G4GUD3_9ALVE|eukprot:Cvel_23420.t1-p1 / transcript=Cvel_23420.t1 / gene=Cvel_23420 / organism=Chromera_velia_CCMP2878 / gene_product=Probable flap endonuclease 1 homolog, putative / transcript_product=Probable flap endonuclease 1 homolog, putative / location=Cvel_scaffold2412:21514-24641(+) / protein_length=723 / sequence_SO=supercontig / SO=protein_coding / is_pseudo=false